jgi:hypothetical protein
MTRRPCGAPISILILVEYPALSSSAPMVESAPNWLQLLLLTKRDVQLPWASGYLLGLFRRSIPTAQCRSFRT